MILSDISPDSIAEATGDYEALGSCSGSRRFAIEPVPVSPVPASIRAIGELLLTLLIVFLCFALPAIFGGS